MWVITVNKKYLLSALDIKRVKGKMLNEDGLKVTEDIEQAYLFETELGCLAMKMFLISIYCLLYDFGMVKVEKYYDTDA